VNDTAFRTEGLTARNSISFPDIEIRSNKATFITGASGTGKTTLLKLFNQTETQTSGKIFFFGKDVNDIDAVALRTDAVLCGQKVFLFDGTIRDNFGGYRKYVLGKEMMADAEIMKYLDICVAERDLDKQCKELSGGERARVFLAIYLSFAPKVLMLDEPTSSLDGDTAVKVMKNIVSHCSGNGMTLIVVSHDIAVTGAVADNVITLGGGQ
jgi:putative ABC transport system ATP-binding protein